MRLLRRVALVVPQLVGSPPAILVAISVVVAWIAWGLLAGWSDSWLLWPSAVASVTTLLIAFSLQYTQNRDTRAIQLKLDEILRAQAGGATSSSARAALGRRPRARRGRDARPAAPADPLSGRDRRQAGACASAALASSSRNSSSGRGLPRK